MPNPIPANPQPTILFQPPNHIGLGHVNRLSSIALALRRIDPTIRTPFALEGSAHILLDTLGLPYLPLPADPASEDSVGSTGWTESERATHSLEISRTILRNLQPQLVVFDCFPNPAFASAALERQVPVVLCLREMRVLDSYLEFVRELLPHLCLILVPHNPEAFNLPPVLQEIARFVGEIARPIVARPPLNDRYARPHIVISGGGGGYPRTVDFYNIALKAVSQLRSAHPSLSARLITGPLFRDFARLELQNGISVIPFEPDMAGVFSEAELVICQGGYNCITELQQVGTKAVLVPARRDWDDQFTRAKKAARTHARFRVLDAATPDELAHLADRLLRESNVSAPASPPHGAARAAEALLAMLKRLSSATRQQRNACPP